MRDDRPGRGMSGVVTGCEFGCVVCGDGVGSLWCRGSGVVGCEM